MLLFFQARLKSEFYLNAFFLQNLLLYIVPFLDQASNTLRLIFGALESNIFLTEFNFVLKEYFSYILLVLSPTFGHHHQYIYSRP